MAAEPTPPLPSPSDRLELLAQQLDRLAVELLDTVHELREQEKARDDA